MEIQLDEAFDENTKTYPVINLKPNLKLPQVWKFDVPGNESLMARMVSFQSDGDNVKNVKMGDKFVQVFLMSLSDKGNAGELRGGLGSDAIGAITTIFDTIAAQAKQYRFDAVLFRLPIKKMKGQGPIVQRIMARLAVQRTAGKFVVLKELWGHSSKYAYVLIRRKNVNLEDIEGIPAISPELFTAVETKAGTTYVDKKSGETVTKDEAFAATIAAKEDNRSSDRQIATKTKISRRDSIMAQYGNPGLKNGWSAGSIEKLDKLNAAPPVIVADGKSDENVELITRSTVAEIRDKTFDGLTDIELYYTDNTEESRQSTSGNFRLLRDTLIHHTKNFNKSVEMITPRTQSQIDQLVKDGLIQYYNILKKFNGKNHLEIFRDLANIVVGSYEVGEITAEQRYNFVTDIIMKFNDDVYKDIKKRYYLLADKLMPNDLSDKEKKAISAYCGSAYSEINDFLQGNDASIGSITDGVIPSLDSSFAKGSTLPKGTPLYRGMSLPGEKLIEALERKMFYFTNFVSASLAPAFVGMYGNAAGSLDRDVSAEVDFDDGDEINKKEISGYKVKPRIGLTINGADKVKVIIPGNLSKFPDECEVILPRGTVIKFNKAWVSRRGSDARSALIESTVVAPEQLTESTEIYDGDALLNEGVVKRLDFSTFFKENYEEDEIAPDTPVDAEPVLQKSRSIIMGNTPDMDILLDLVQPMPEKFEMM